MTVAAPERQREAKRLWAAKNARKGQDIGPIGFVADPARRLACSRDFRLYCETYHRPTFHMGWSDDHLKVLRQVEAAVFNGELFATACPRGFGKTSIAEAAVEFAVLNGHHAFAVLLGSDKDAATAMLESLRTELEINDSLADDYPEVCVPIAKLDGIANRCKGQRYGEERTRIEWTTKAIVLPSVKPKGWADREDHRPFLRPDGYTLASGGILKVAGITGGIRGMKHKRADGKSVRPSLVVPDDPQTDASARSPSQCATRERILAGAVLGLAGPGRKIAGIMPCTVIQAGDMADNLLNREKHPEWHGTRTKLVYAFPTETAKWEEYSRLRSDALKDERQPVEANALYAQHRAEMDAGAVVAWAERFNEDEISAIQHAMNLRIDRGDHAFFAEYQNDPLPPEDTQGVELTPDQILAKLSNLRRAAVPQECDRLTAMIDVQQEVLYYAVCAWEGNFSGSVIDFGTFPDQQRLYFALSDVRNTLSRLFPSMGEEGRIYAGIERLTDALLGREWLRPDGTAFKVERLLVDAGKWTDTVLKACRESKYAAIVTPSHGQFFGPDSKPMREYRPEPGGRIGYHWRIPGQTRGASRHVLIDTNHWKSFLHRRLAVAKGDPGCLTLFGSDAKPHRMLADHLTAEGCFPQISEKTGRRVEVWKQKPGRPDNHLLDCLVGCMVGASMLGVSLPEATAAGPQRKRRRLTRDDFGPRRGPTPDARP